MFGHVLCIHLIYEMPYIMVFAPHGLLDARPRQMQQPMELKQSGNLAFGDETGEIIE